MEYFVNAVWTVIYAQLFASVCLGAADSASEVEKNIVGYFISGKEYKLRGMDRTSCALRPQRWD